MPRTVRSPILGFTATPKTAPTPPHAAPPHDFLLMSLCPQLTPELTPLAAHTHAGTQIAAITTGTLRYTVIKGKPVKVLKPNALGTKPEFIRTIKAGETYDVKAGYSVIEPAGTAHKVQVVGATEVVIYVASLFTNGEPVSIPYVTAS